MNKLIRKYRKRLFKNTVLLSEIRMIILFYNANLSKTTKQNLKANIDIKERNLSSSF